MTDDEIDAHARERLRRHCDERGIRAQTEDVETLTRLALSLIQSHQPTNTRGNHGKAAAGS